MKRKAAKIFERLFWIIFFSNLLWMAGAKYFFAETGKGYRYVSQNKQFVFIEIPPKGRGLSMMKSRWRRWKGESGCRGDDCKLYRTFKRNWLKFWLWHDYISHPRWDYPYLKENNQKHHE